MNRFETELSRRRGILNDRLWHFDRATHEPAQVRPTDDGGRLYMPGRWAGQTLPGINALDRAGTCRRTAAVMRAAIPRRQWLRRAHEWLETAKSCGPSTIY